MSTTTTNAGPTSRDWGRLANRAYEQHFLPDEVAEPAVNAAMSAYHDAVGAYEAAKSESGTTMTEAEADRADRQALADLLEKGKDSSATPARDKFMAERAAHERKLEALALIVNRREADLRRTLDEHRQDVIGAHTANAEKLSAEVMAGLDELAAKCNALGLELRKAEWAAAWPDKWRGRQKVWRQGLIVARPRGGDVVFSDSLFDTIRRALNKAVGGPEPEPANGPLHITPTLTGRALTEAGPVPDEAA